MWTDLEIKKNMQIFIKIKINVWGNWVLSKQTGQSNSNLNLGIALNWNIINSKRNIAKQRVDSEGTCI